MSLFPYLAEEKEEEETRHQNKKEIPESLLVARARVTDYYGLPPNINISSIPSGLDRGKSVCMLDNILGNMGTSIDLEKGILAFTLDYVTRNPGSKNFAISIYENKLEEILNNLGRLGNKNLIQGLKQKTLDPSKVGLMSPSQLFPTNWEAYERRIGQRKQYTESKAVTSFYKCFRCKDKRTKVTQMQTRSADEPITNFIVCLTCGNTWKV